MLVKEGLLGEVVQKHLLNHAGRWLRFDLLASLYDTCIPSHHEINTCERAFERDFYKWLQSVCIMIWYRSKGQNAYHATTKSFLA